MRETKNEWRVLYRNKLMLVVLLAEVAILNFYWIGAFLEPKFLTPYWGFMALYKMFHCLPLFFIPLFYVAYEFMARPRETDFYEAICSLSGKLQMITGKLLVLLFYLIFLCVNFGGYCVAAFSRYNLPALLITQLIQSIVLNFFLPGLIAILGGFLLALTLKRLGAILSVLGLVFLLTDLSEPLYYTLSVFHFPVRAVRQLLAIGIPYSESFHDHIYGFPVERYRYALAFFWISLLVAGLAIKILAQSKGWRIGVCASSLLITLFCGYCLANPGGYLFVQSIDYNYGDPVTQAKDYGKDQFYYSYVAASQEESQTFSITRYDMKIKVTDRLKAKVEVGVDRVQSQYDFTLHHAYAVSKVLAEGGLPLDFVQEGDYLTVQNPGGATSFSIQYEGGHPIYYSNDQAVNLPGYWAYYPRAGKRRTYGSDSVFESPWYLFLRENHPIPVTLQLEGNRAIYTNLAKDQDGIYRGETTGVSLLGGLVEQKRESGGAVRVVGAISISNKEKNLSGVASSASRELAKMESSYNLQLELPPFTQEQYLEFPITLNDYSQAVAFSDHIAYREYISPRQLAADFLVSSVSHTNEKAVLANRLRQYLDDPDNLSLFAGADPVLWYNDAGTMVGEAMNTSIEQRGEEETVRDILMYLQGDEDARSLYAFCRDLERGEELE